MVLNPSKRKINRRHWKEHIEVCSQSNQTQKEYCLQQQLNLASFQRWRRIFKADEREVSPTPVAFLPVRIEEPTSAQLTVVINSTLRIEIPARFDPSTLKELIQVLQTS